MSGGGQQGSVSSSYIISNLGKNEDKGIYKIETKIM
jgi:hypothetical protein